MERVTVKIDRPLLERLERLGAGSDQDLNQVIERLLFHGERKVELEAESPHYTMEQELQRERDGVFAGSGICS